MKETNKNINMKSRAFPSSDAQGVDLHPVKIKINIKAKRTRLANLNIGTLKGKTRELASINKRKVDIACIQYKEWKGQKTLIIGNGCKSYYNGIVSNRNGVGCKEEEKDDFRAILDKAVIEILKDDLVIIGEDLNAHVGKPRDSYKRHHGGFEYGERNDEGEHVLKFAQAFHLALTNPYYRKKDSHLITCESATRKTQIDYLLISRRRLKDLIDCKVIQGEDIAEHKLLVK
ncbi:uncharacterized protein LOC135930328 [Gordionus sp. m RMFG-2023]|uniref:uncharacterized protein LOC135930328 n=1 Tax=Gordionus sp. m RMFG-2023 TaxID=3053472 RepID=UPI0031FD2D04